MIVCPFCGDGVRTPERKPDVGGCSCGALRLWDLSKVDGRSAYSLGDGAYELLIGLLIEQKDRGFAPYAVERAPSYGATRVKKRPGYFTVEEVRDAMRSVVAMEVLES